MEQWSDFIWVAIGVLWVLIQLFRRRGERGPAARQASRPAAPAAKPPPARPPASSRPVPPAITGADPTPVPRAGEAPPPIGPR